MRQGAGSGRVPAQYGHSTGTVRPHRRDTAELGPQRLEHHRFLLGVVPVGKVWLGCSIEVGEVEGLDRRVLLHVDGKRVANEG